MKKLWIKIQNWAQSVVSWGLIHFNNPLIRKVEFDAFTVKFRRYTMDIETKSHNLKLRTIGMVYPNALLIKALETNDTKIIEWFCYELYQFVTLITTDNGLINDVDKAFQKYYKRKEKEAESLAKEVTPEAEAIAQGTIEANIEYAKMNKKERKVYKRALREVLIEDGPEWMQEKQD